MRRINAFREVICVGTYRDTPNQEQLNAKATQ